MRDAWFLAGDCRPVRFSLFNRFISHQTVFFSHNKSAVSAFQPTYKLKRTGPASLLRLEPRQQPAGSGSMIISLYSKKRGKPTRVYRRSIDFPHDSIQFGVSIIHVAFRLLLLLLKLKMYQLSYYSSNTLTFLLNATPALARNL
uniref:Uncharacterized protein n=1 Tax=Setaria viridis TaxID=4556 RepID=A0A4U6TLD3_SETVI|nr:hypothetical protein SEVIR_8G218300v2 [Setaria viridis]